MARINHPRGRCALVLLLAIWVSGCAPKVDLTTLPDVPRVDVSGYQPAVRAQVEQARTQFEKQPANPAANGMLGKLYRVYRDFEAAEVLLRRARVLDPRNMEWTYLHGEALEQLADNQGALAAMNAVLAREPDDAPAQLRAARMRLALGDTQGAIAALETLVAAAPELGDAHVAYAQALTARGTAADAIAVWERAIEKFGSFKTAHYGLAQLYRRQGDTKRAADHLWLFEVVDTTDPPPLDPRLAQLFRLNQSDRAIVLAAQAVKRTGDKARTLALLEQALERNPQNLEARAALIMGYTEQSDFESALRHGQEGVRIDPHHAELGLALGRLELQQGELGSAITRLTNLVMRSPQHASGLAWLGRARLLRGDVAQAGVDLRAAIAVEPAHLAARRFYVAWLTAHATLAEAIAELGKLAETPARDVPLVLSSLAQMQVRAEQLDEAVKSLDRGVDIARLQQQERLVTKLVNQRQRLMMSKT